MIRILRLNTGQTHLKCTGSKPYMVYFTLMAMMFRSLYRSCNYGQSYFHRCDVSLIRATDKWEIFVND